MIGIYKLTSPSGKCYIGQSVNIENRLNKYKNMLCKFQHKIYRALVKYGWDNFTVEILYSTDKDYKYQQLMLDSMEKHFIIQFDSIKNGYNLRTGGTSGYKYSDEVKEKMSQSKLGTTRSEKTKSKISNTLKLHTRTEEHKINNGLSKRIPILQYDKNNNFIREWDSIKSAREELKISNISNCLSGKYKTSGGFIWKYKDDLVGMFKNME